MGPKHFGVTTLTFVNHATWSVTWPFDSPYPISYSSSIVTKPLSAAFFEILGPKIIGSRPWPFKVTWRHRSCDQSIPHMPFAIGCPLTPRLYLLTFSRYSTPNSRAHTHTHTHRNTHTDTRRKWFLPCDAVCTVSVIVILSVRPSVCLSLCHTRGLCPHGSTYDHDFFTAG